MTLQEVADLLGIPIQTLRDLRWKGLAPAAVKVGSQVRFRPEDVREWIDANRENSENKK